jgi:hypothetical protein
LSQAGRLSVRGAKQAGLAGFAGLGWLTGLVSPARLVLLVSEERPRLASGPLT